LVESHPSIAQDDDLKDVLEIRPIGIRLDRLGMDAVGRNQKPSIENRMTRRFLSRYRRAGRVGSYATI
jgi:hypothetical protein